jgi:hypothetical protein
MDGSLFTEAVVVGLALLPTYFFTRAVVDAVLPRWSDTSQEYVAVFLSGGVFHVLCEETGINDWYLDNGVAVMKRLETHKVETLTDDVCDGSCGWSATAGMCSHYSVHAMPLTM